MVEQSSWLTPEQEQAVARRSEPLLLSAGAGSGKTSVLVERFVQAVRDDGVAPGKILAITFTERAAGELRERVRARFLELGEREAARDTEAAFLGTFHGFCARLLRAHPLLAGLDPDFAIIEEGLAGRLREQAFSVALRELLSGDASGRAVDLIAAYSVDRIAAMIGTVYAQLRSRGQRLPRLAPVRVDWTEPYDIEAASACLLLDQLLGDFGRAYERLKLERRAVDFDDLELRARDLLEGWPSVAKTWSERFELLMVDEFQDTNPRQLSILGALERENLFTVGDELQSIYGFRHADVELFRIRRDELEARGASLALTANFRSRAPLLDVINAVFAERFTGFSALRAGRRSAQAPMPAAPAGMSAEPLTELLLTDRDGWEEDRDLARDISAGLPRAPLWRQAEARLLAQRIAELIDGGAARGGDVVILLRALGDIDVYERALQQAGVRTLAAVGAFWEHQQVGDLLAYLRALANPLDEVALYSTLASPLAGVTRDGLALLALAARAQRSGAWETALRGEAEPLLGELSGADRDAMTHFCAHLGSERERVGSRSIAELIERAIDHSGYRNHALGLDWGERRLANIHKLLRLARRFEAEEGRDLRGFLDHVAHLLAASNAAESDAPVEGVEPDAVRLMSIHAAKGLEFPVVCVADLGRAANTRLADLLLDGSRIGLQLVRLDGGKATPALEYRELAEERRRAEAEEEDRILYVAMTRARERLLLSGAVAFERWPEVRQGSTAVSWLAPALSPEIPALAQAARLGGQELSVGVLATAPINVILSTRATLGHALRRDSLRAFAGGAPSENPPGDRGGSRPGPPRAEVSRRAAEGASVGERPAPPIASLSYTALAELERCGYRYYLERVLGLGEDRSAMRAPGSSPGLPAQARGILIHRLLESLDFKRQAAPTEKAVGEIARELRMSLPSGESARIAELLQTSIRSTLARRLAAARGLSREHPFAFSVGPREPLVTGVIDVLAREGEAAFLVLDYKSDRVAEQADLRAVVEREYGLQRLLYALAVLRDGAATVEVVHWFLERPEEWVTASYDAQQRPELERLLVERVRAARRRGFVVSHRPHRGLCLTCPGRVSLCSWSEDETMREDPVEA